MNKKMQLLFLTTTGLLLAAILLYRSGTQLHTVVFVIPSDYSGLFYVVPDENNGQVIPNIDGTFRLVIPRKGILRVKADNFLTTYHRSFATTDAGANLEFGAASSFPTKRAVREIYSSFNDLGGYHLFHVGDDIDARRFANHQANADAEVADDFKQRTKPVP